MSSSRYFRISNPFSSNSTTMFFQRLFAMANHSFSSSSSSSKPTIQAIHDICKKNLSPSTAPPHQVIHELSSLLVRLAKLATDKVLSAPCGTSILYPKTGGNLHCFTAVTSCAVLDILTPPYEESAGRKCTYYRDYPYASFQSGGEPIDGKEEEYAWLEETETPDDLYMRPGMYVGPPLQI